MEIMPGAIHIRQARTKMLRKAMNGMVYRTKTDKKSQIHGQVVVQINDTHIVIKDLAVIVHPLQNHRKFDNASKESFEIFVKSKRSLTFYSLSHFFCYIRFSKNAPNNYRGRSNGSYNNNNNNGNNAGNGVGNARTNGNGNSNSFYRNNDNTFYQNGSRGADKSSDNKNFGSDVKNFSANRSYNRNPQRNNNNTNNANSQSSNNNNNNKKNVNFIR